MPSPDWTATTSASVLPVPPPIATTATEAGRATVERGRDTYDVVVREVTGADRDRIYDDQAKRYPGFAEYATKTAGIRTIPVIALQRG